MSLRADMYPQKAAEAKQSAAKAKDPVVALARSLRRRRPKGGRRSFQDISNELATRGYLNERGHFRRQVFARC
jgi:hypothetical protein